MSGEDSLNYAIEFRVHKRLFAPKWLSHALNLS